MKALSLWQPWASAIALGAKRIETRSWSTNYRGPMAIHAAKRRVLSELAELEQLPPFQAAFWPGYKFLPFADELPFGSVVATANLVDCRPTHTFGTEDIHEMNIRQGAPEFPFWTEDDMGDFEWGRFGWVLEDIVPLVDPVPYRGAQGLFEIPDEVLWQ